MRLIQNNTDIPAATLVLANDEDVHSRADELRSAAAVMLHFPKWTDGRAYSQAVLLRGRLRYGGEILARGEVLVDMLPLLRRCGFDAVQLRADQSLEAAARVLDVLPRPFPGHYQGDAAGSRPLFAGQAA
jgi:uncharacterized protein (DUF934 family)